MKTKSETIAEALVIAINRGEYTDNLPSEKDLAKKFNTTTVTASKALNILQDRKIVKRIPRLGTFINKETSVPIKIWVHFSENIVQAIGNILNNKFPQLEIQLTNRFDDNPLNEDFDIIRTSATFPYDFNKCFKPLPSRLVTEFEDDKKYFSQLLDISGNYSVYYTLPILFSPMVMLVNKDILNELGIQFSPVEMSIEGLLEIARKIKASKYIFSSGDSLLWLRYILFRNLDYRERKTIEEFKAILESRLPLLVSLFECMGNDSRDDFFDGNLAFAIKSRQQLYFPLSRGKQSFRWEIMPMPQLENSKTAVAAELMGVVRTSKHGDYIFDVLQAFLDDDVQSLIAREKYGLPIKKAFIAETLGYQSYRDDVFISEIANINIDNGINHDLYAMCLPISQKFICGQCSAKEFAQKAIGFFLEIAASHQGRLAAQTSYNFNDM